MPIHDLLTSETQLRSSPSVPGTSLVGLERDVCQRERVLLQARGRRESGRKSRVVWIDTDPPFYRRETTPVSRDLPCTQGVPQEGLENPRSERGWDRTCSWAAAGVWA